MIRRTPANKRLASAAEILGLDPQVADPVMIILAAQLRLRRCRRFQATGNRRPTLEARRIAAARDALLDRSIGGLVPRCREHPEQLTAARLASQGGVEAERGEGFGVVDERVMT